MYSDFFCLFGISVIESGGDAVIGDQHRFNREPFVALPGVEKIVGISAIQQVSLEKLSLGAVRNSAEAAMLWSEKTLYTYAISEI